MKQILQIHAVLPGQKPEKQFSIPQRGESLSRQQTQEQPPVQAANGASLAQPEAAFAQQGAQQQPPIQQESQQYAKQEPQVQQVQQQLASVDLNQSTPQSRSSNGHEPINFSPYHPEGDSAYAPPPAQSHPAQGQTDEINPPSKLLHSNPAPEPTRDDRLRRKDSETQEEDEFHDAHS